MYHARLLRSLDRREESRDVAAHALGLPLWSLGYDLGEVRQITKCKSETSVMCRGAREEVRSVRRCANLLRRLSTTALPTSGSERAVGCRRRCDGLLLISHDLPWCTLW